MAHIRGEGRTRRRKVVSVDSPMSLFTDGSQTTGAYFVAAEVVSASIPDRQTT